MYRNYENERKNRDYHRRRGQKRLQRRIIGFSLFTFLLGFLFGRAVLAAEQIFYEPEKEAFVRASAKQKEEEGTEDVLFLGGALPDVQKEEEAWNLCLVNWEHSLPSDFTVELTEVGEGHQVDSRIAQALLDMIAAGKRDGHQIWIASSYRTMQKQTDLYENKVANLKKQGYSETEARKEAGTVVAVPGTSEHQLGLAVDLVSSEYTGLDERQEQTKSYQWLVRHCAEYGFILRYPNGKTDITGIIYEPWHFRYVGKEVAEEIMEAGICLEEYLEQKPV